MNTLADGECPRFGSWVVLHEERCRRGRRYHVALNRRDGQALQLDDDDAELCGQIDGHSRVCDLRTTASAADLLDVLWHEGFFTNRPAELDQPKGRRAQDDGARGLISRLEVRWKGADRVVRAAHRRFLWSAFTPSALLGQATLAVAGLIALVVLLRAGHPLQLRMTAAHVPIVLGVGMLATVAHELAHALVLIHHGGTVRSAGFRLHLGTPAFYVESLDSLLLTPRQRMMQAAAGPWAEWLVTSAAALVLVTASSALNPILYRFVILNSVTVVSNLLPFVGLDGYWLLADGVREPDLAQRCRQCPLELLRGRTRPTLEHAALIGYAVANGAVAAGLLVLSGFFWFELFGSSLIGLFHGGPVGWLVLAGIAFVFFRPAILRAVSSGSASIRWCRRMANRASFRLQRRWRVRAVRRLACLEEVRGLGGRGLGIIAGGVERVVLRQRRALVREAFEGFVLVSGVPPTPVHGHLHLRSTWSESVVLVPRSLLDRARALDVKPSGNGIALFV